MIYSIIAFAIILLNSMIQYDDRFPGIGICIACDIDSPVKVGRRRQVGGTFIVNLVGMETWVYAVLVLVCSLRREVRLRVVWRISRLKNTCHNVLDFVSCKVGT